MSSSPRMAWLVQWSWIVAGVLLANIALPWGHAQESEQVRGSPGEQKRVASRDERTVQVEFTDGGKLQLVLEFDQLQIESPYGMLQIPVEEIRELEFATRLPPGVRKKIDDAIFALGSVDFATREAAQNDLLKLREKAFPVLVVATKHADLEIAQRAQELVVKLRDSMPADKLVVRDYGVVTTAHSKISGKIPDETFSVGTAQFGHQQMKLSDVLVLRSAKSAPPIEEVANVEPDPGTLNGVRSEIGKTFAYRVTGRGDSFIWGTGIYTSDSTLAMAAVHAGVLKLGETGVVRVTIVPPPPVFAGSTQNGISSSPYGPFSGAYQIVVRRK